MASRQQGLLGEKKMQKGMQKLDRIEENNCIHKREVWGEKKKKKNEGDLGKTKKDTPVFEKWQRDKFLTVVNHKTKSRKSPGQEETEE